MIGQNKLKNKLNNLKELPKFMIFNGLKGCGKKTLGKEIANKFNYDFVLLSNKIDEIRQMIGISNDNLENIIYYIDNGNSMSLNALNSLLKICEETPNKIIIILSVEMKELIPNTLLSRADIWNFEEYTINDFKDYLGEDKFESKIDYEFIYPNLSYLDKNINGIMDFCNHLLEKPNYNLLNTYTNDAKNKYDIFQVNWILYTLCLQKEKYDFINIISEANKQLLNNYYNKDFIFKNMLLKFGDVYES